MPGRSNKLLTDLSSMVGTFSHEVELVPPKCLAPTGSCPLCQAISNAFISCGTDGTSWRSWESTICSVLYEHVASLACCCA